MQVWKGDGASGPLLRSFRLGRARNGILEVQNLKARHGGQSRHHLIHGTQEVSAGGWGVDDKFCERRAEKRMTPAHYRIAYFQAAESWATEFGRNGWYGQIVVGTVWRLHHQHSKAREWVADMRPNLADNTCGSS